MQHGTISYDKLVVSVFDLRHEKKTVLRPRKKNSTATTKEKLLRQENAEKSK